MKTIKLSPVVRGFVAACLLLAIGGILSSHAAAQNAVASEEVLDKIASEGSARVIVKLRTPGAYRNEHGLSQAAVSRQRSDIAATQRRVRGQLRGTVHTVRREFRTMPYLSVDIDAQGLARLQAAADVESVYVDRLMRPFLAESVFQVEGDLAHQAGIDGTGYAIAVLDTGADKNHSFLAGKVIHEACFALNDDGVTGACPNGQPTMVGDGAAAPCTYDPLSCFHGTHVSGIAVGSGATFTGVAPGADLIPIQVFHPSLNCGFFTTCAVAFTSDLAAALEHVYDIRDQFPIAAVNMSLGGSLYSGVCDADFPLMTDAINNLRAVGIPSVVASGNSGAIDAMSSPACISSAISVGAVDGNDAVAYFSNVSSDLDLFAPGTDIVSSVPGGTFESFDGTSMATPHVAGAWAILDQANPAGTIDEDLTLLQTYGRPVTDTRGPDAITRSRIRLGPAAGVENPVPVLTSVSPSPVVTWGPDTILTVTGSDFARSSAVLVDGAAIATSYISDTELSAILPAALLATTASSLEITVQSPPLGGGTSAPLTLPLVPPSLTVDVTTAGAGEPITATLTNAPGGSFDRLSFAEVSSPETVYVTSTIVTPGQSTFTWTVNAPFTPGLYEFRLHPNSGAVRAATSPTVDVLPPVPQLTSLTPSRVAANGPDLTVSVQGAYFATTSQVYVDGVARPTTYVSTATLSVVVPASDMATAASSLQITAVTPEAGSTPSNALPLAIAHPTLAVSTTAAAVGETVTVTLDDGPGNATDWLALAAVGSPDNTYLTWSYVPAGAITSTWDVAMPSTPGDYEVRLFENGGFRRLATSDTITVSDGTPGPSPTPTLDVSATAVSAGETVTVTLADGPGNATDWLALAAVGSPDNTYLTWTYVPAGATSFTWNVAMPTTPGDYEVRLFEDGGFTRLATSATITVGSAPPQTATLDVSATEVGPGETVTVTLTGGPGNASDWLALAAVGSPDNTYLRWTYVPAGATSTTWNVAMPDTPGDYEIRLFENGGFTRLATSATITVSTAPTGTATLDVSATAVAPGETVTVTLTNGPGNATDWLALASVESPDNTYLRWTYVTAGATSFTWNVAMPETPGDYEIRLFEDGGFTRLATSATITVEAATTGTATLDVSATAAGPGESVTVTLTDGPGNATDWLALASVGSPDTTYLQWTYVPAGATSTTWTVTMPATPGDYEFRLFENNGYTRVATSATITVSTAPTGTATLDVSATAVAAGDPLTVTLTDGPGNSADWLALASVGSPDTTYLQWTNVPSGATTTTWNLTMPTTPGDYEIRLYEDGGFTRLATSATITVSAAPTPAATLAVSATAVSVGETVAVTLSDGPGNSADWLALASVESPDTTYVKWTYIPAGATSFTWNVAMPATPGDYEVRLFENNGFTRLATSDTIAVSP